MLNGNVTKKIAATSLIFALLLNSNVAAASELNLCESQLSECDAVLELADEVIKQQSETIDQLDSQNLRLMKALEQEYASNNSEPPFYKKPEVVSTLAFILGIVAGAYASKQLAR